MERDGNIPVHHELLPVNIVDLTCARIAIERYQRRAPLRDTDRDSLTKIGAAVQFSAQTIHFYESGGHEGNDRLLPSNALIVKSVLGAFEAGRDRPAKSSQLEQLTTSIKSVLENPQGFEEDQRVATGILADFLERWELAEHQLIGSYGTENS